ncbi:unnamed protein product [Oppiella nova]|uniref:Uncharacterized protein n=1 Tax=Oppiella nova TaxID=334625 RepID=A0A7R9MLL6_9ACAR|nr:unnamed protein product [Oppiella nova]CAG2179688.1 unnamed protein product [Oppiella nova]
MARKTKELYPSPTYVPWVTIDGKFDKKSMALIESNLINFVCLKANPRPIECPNSGATDYLQQNQETVPSSAFEA